VHFKVAAARMHLPQSANWYSCLNLHIAPATPRYSFLLQLPEGKPCCTGRPTLSQLTVQYRYHTEQTVTPFNGTHLDAKDMGSIHYELVGQLGVVGQVVLILLRVADIP
jgi:hypothetical protein